MIENRAQLQITRTLFNQVFGFPPEWTVTEIEIDHNRGMLNIYLSGPGLPAVQEGNEAPHLMYYRDENGQPNLTDHKLQQMPLATTNGKR